ncbi:c-type cytochrome biogenesis protein CcmI [Candidatus Nitrosacidococcus sp. I8]|uniref:c-type cytochrome biogenesis protein CcmI n=1 Tax=Candidatus Nitrosacidococcus sp. I8 TaxID=2942908 RepID=UPI002226F4B1|nr:c-type cytochrome biogenesis protein CcmI [Candidatus Nitrosacidococcus sp. I8]CAH9018986.1 hypothetical protein NURINAE_01260 [Candidatus Nitrosacidococcus sp. I8]
MTPFSTFWIIAGVMSLFALGFLLTPLLQRSTLKEDDETTAEIAIYKERLQELKTDLKSGTITESQFSQARHELEEAMASDLAATHRLTHLEIKRHWLVALMLVFILPSLASLIYWKLGSGNEVSEQLAVEENSKQEMNSMHHAIGSLQDKLAENPDDIQGWRMLGRSYLSTNEFSNAAEALSHAYVLDDQNPDVILDLAEALAGNQGRGLQGAPQKLIQRALIVAPDYPKALWFASINALQANRKEEAKGYLQQLASQLTPGSEEEKMVRAHLAQLTDSGMGDVASSSPVSNEGNSESTTASTEPPRIEVQVSLDSEIGKKIDNSATVFIFAKAAKGPPIPLAAVRKQVKDLPLTVVLDDSKSMAPNFKMSNFSEFKVGARISFSGNPVPQSGDFEGYAEGTLPATPADPVAIVINQQVP